MPYLPYPRRTPTAVEVLEDRLLLASTPFPRLGLGGPSLQAASRIDAPLRALAQSAGTGTPAASKSGLPGMSSLFATDDAGRVAVQITAKYPRALLPRLVKLGFKPTFVSYNHRMLEGFMPTGTMLQADALVSYGLLGMTPSYGANTGAGLANSQGDFVLEADRVRSTLPTTINGTGINVGVISDSYNRLGGAPSGVANGDLPAGVNVVLEGPTGSSDEGRAMAEIVHDIAPGAGIAFGSAFYSQGGFAQTIRDLANPAIGNAKVITDDIFYFEEPMFQDGVIAQAIDEVSAQGVSYFSLAGNLGSQSYESVYRSTNDSLFPGKQVFDFNPGAGTDTRQRITLAAGQSIILTLQWDDPFYTVNGTDADIDVYLLDGGTNTVLAGSERDNIATQIPSEVFQYTNTGAAAKQVDLAISLWGGTAPSVIKWVNYGANNSGAVTVNEYATNSPTVIPHSAAAGGLSVAAVPYYGQNVTETYSSLGPATMYFNANGTRKAVPEVRQAPDITAVDGVDTTFFGSDVDGNGRPNFFGTSAAAPHAAAVAALVKQANPSFTPTQIYTRMQSTAYDLGAAGFDNLSGAGLLDAYGAVLGPVVPATLPIVDGLESGSLGQAWETASTGAGRKAVTASSSPAAGTRHLTFESSIDGTFGRNEATLHVNASGAAGNLILTFDQKEFDDDDHAMPASFTTGSDTDGVALSVDGITWYRVVSLTGTASTNSYQSSRYNLSLVAAANGITLGSDTRIRFQQFDNFSIAGGDGMAFDNIRVAAAGVTVAPISGLTTTESAGTAQFSVVLDAVPSASVTVPISTSDATEGTPGGSSLTFTTGNWNVPQFVTVTGVADAVVDGNVGYAIETGVTTSADPAYSGLNPADVSVTNQDVVVPVSIVSWASLAEHGPGVGEVGLTIPDTGSFSEGRASGVRTLLVTFSSAINPASLLPAGIGLWGNNVNNLPINLASYTPTFTMRNGDTVAVITLSQSLPDYARYLVRITGVTSATGAALTGDNDRVLTALRGDLTGDLRTNSTDVGGAVSLRGINPIDPLIVEQVRSDLTVDGRINSTDVGGAVTERGKDARNILDPVP